MNLKKIKIAAIINIFLLSFLSHFIYKIFPNTLITFFFPVNESIFEHMKIIFTSTLIYGIIDYTLLKLNKIPFQNFIFQLTLTSFISIPIFLILYLPIHFIIGEYLIITLLILLITYLISQLISYKILTSEPVSNLKIISITFIIIVYIIFIIFTYFPPHNYFFYDSNTKSYGIPK